MNLSKDFYLKLVIYMLIRSYRNKIYGLLVDIGFNLYKVIIEHPFDKSGEQSVGVAEKLKSFNT